MADVVAESHVGRPTSRLRPYVARYIGYRFEGFPAGVHVGVPSRHLTMVLSLAGPLEVSDARDADGQRTSLSALVGGLHTSPVFIHHDGNQHGVQLWITPLGSRALFGLPASELATKVIPLGAVLGRLSGELGDRIAAASTWSDRFGVLDDVLARALTDPRQPRDEVVFAWRRLVETGGSIEVAAIAHDAGWSRRHLSSRFRDELGLSPKTLGRIVRFERARRLLTDPSRPSLARTAAEVGYADQAHLTRDWRQFAGLTPTAWLTSEVFPFVQDTEMAFERDSRHE